MGTIEMHIRNDEGNAVYVHKWNGATKSEIMTMLELFVDHALTTLSDETRIPRTWLLSMLFDSVKNDWKEGEQNDH